MPLRFVAVHGHFYQPPRENPWLEAVEVQDSAAPWHDWNERITAECYAPNTAARRVDEANRILDVVNNFEKISFDIGPTLFAWLARHAPEVARRIVEADRASVRERGHGNAIAQVYNHMIMPLATRRDKVTQVRWGITDFRARFDRDPEGMWLPETAVDDETLEVLAEAGLRFTILAPEQARRVRPLGADDWEETDGRLDPTRAYLWRGPRGLRLAVFFYDGTISHAIAFGGVLGRSENFVTRLTSALADGGDRPQLVHCATDGESYGHHSRFGEMALAAAVRALEGDPTLALTNYGAFLAAHPPTHEVEIHQRTSWSCAHGVERWRADCGCRVRPESHQGWRGPLRDALDWLRDQVDPFYEARASAWLKDPWAAREEYVSVVLDRGPARLESFLARHQRAALDATARLETRRLLELQRNRLLMYTSCGWFFDEISGLEPVQVLRYAAMTLQYLRDLGAGDLEHAFVQRLAEAPSNVPEYGNGAGVWRRLIRPAVVRLPRVVAHYAITGLFEDHPEEIAVYAYRVRRLDEARASSGGTTLRLARVSVASEATGETTEATYAAAHFGGHDVTCAIRAWRDAATWERVKADLLARCDSATLADLVRGMDDHFPGTAFALPHLFIEERRRVLARVISTVLERHEETYRRVWEESRKLVHYLREADAPVPEPLALVARHVLGTALVAEVQALDGAGDAGPLPPRVLELGEEARNLGLPLDLAAARDAMHRIVDRALDAVDDAPTREHVLRASQLLDGVQYLRIPFGRWATQNRFFDIWQRRALARPLLTPLAESLGFHLPLD